MRKCIYVITVGVLVVSSSQLNQALWFKLVKSNYWCVKSMVIVIICLIRSQVLSEVWYKSSHLKNYFCCINKNQWLMFFFVKFDKRMKNSSFFSLSSSRQSSASSIGRPYQTCHDEIRRANHHQVQAKGRKSHSAPNEAGTKARWENT